MYYQASALFLYSLALDPCSLHMKLNLKLQDWMFLTKMLSGNHLLTFYAHRLALSTFHQQKHLCKYVLNILCLHLKVDSGEETGNEGRETNKGPWPKLNQGCS